MPPSLTQNKMNFQEIYQKYPRETWLGVVTFMFIIPYFFINGFSHGRTETTFYTFIEQQIPVIPITVIIYVSCFVMAFVPYLFIKNKEKFKRLAWSYLVAMGITYLIFLIFPIKAVRPEIIGNSFFQQALGWLYTLDNPYNNFPSLHVGLSLLAAYWVYSEDKKWGRIIFTWAILIIISTLTTKQHTFADILGGTAVSLLAYSLFSKIKEKNEPLQPTGSTETSTGSNQGEVLKSEL